MKKKHIIILIISITANAVMLCMICFLVSFFTRERPFEDILPADTPYTYSVSNTDYEVDFKYKDALKVRKYFYNFTLIAKTPKKIFNTAHRDTLNVYLDNGDKHSIVIMGSKEILGFPVGVIEYNGVQYFVDEWLYKYGELLCSTYHDECWGRIFD